MDGSTPDANANGIPDVCETKVYWTDTILDKILRANRDGSGLEDLVTTGLVNPKGIAIDAVAGKMFWADTATDKLQRANLDGTDVEDLVTGADFNSDVSGIALDAARGKVYWAGDERIWRANFDGSDVQQAVLDAGFVTRLAVDIAAGKIYWAGSGIKRANLDGSAVETILAGPGTVYDVELDLAVGKVYWSDGSNILRAYLDGTAVETLAAVHEFVLDMALDLTEGKLYWAHKGLGTIERANLDGSDREIIVNATVQPWAIALGVQPPDCNENGVPDYEDIIVGASEDCTANSVPDECEPDCNNNGVADSCDIVDGISLDCNGRGYGVPDECELADGTSSDCDGNGVPDECDVDCNDNGLVDRCEAQDGAIEDCNENWIPDECDIASGTSTDANSDGIPDDCQCVIAAPPRPGATLAINRYVSFTADTPGRIQAVRVVFDEALATGDFAEGSAIWVSEPEAVSRAGGVVDPADAPDFPVFWAATLEAQPFFTDWDVFDMVHVSHETIVPDSAYAVQAVDSTCPVDVEEGFSAALVVMTALWGDVCSPSGARLCEAGPDGSVDIVSDVLGVLNGFSNRPTAIVKARVDLEPATPDRLITILDAVMAIDAFRGLPYPFAPSTIEPCP